MENTNSSQNEPIELEDDDVAEIQEQESTVTDTLPSVGNVNPPLKRMRTLRSPVWDHFVILGVGPDGIPRARCKKCEKIYQCTSANGTKTLARHIEKCSNTVTQDIGQMILSRTQSSMALQASKFDPDVFRELIAKSICRHCLPFQFVEYEGIREAFEYANKEATLKSRNTAKADVLKIYDRERTKIRNLLSSIPGRIGLTSDLWTSIANDGYITMTAHFIDKDWVLQKRILNFSYIATPHTGLTIYEKIYSLLCYWGIEKKLVSFTLDNATSNDLFVNMLRGQLNMKNALYWDGKFFHIRCCCHIINLIVQEGLKVIDASVLKIRESVKYFRGSQGRKKAFIDSVKEAELPFDKGLRQDVGTRWDSCYFMLDSSLFYRSAFEHLALRDMNYTYCPSDEEWGKVEKICKFLGVFNNATRVFSGTKYPTTNLYFCEVFLIQHTIIKAIESTDEFMKDMGLMMWNKFDKYWSDHNMILAIAVIFDPRYKIQFVEYCYNLLYGGGSNEMKLIRESLFGIFNVYVSETSSTRTSATDHSQQSEQTSVHNARNDDNVLKNFDTFESEEFASFAQKSELELYLSEPRMPRNAKLEVLDYWKAVQFRYPLLAKMARDILCIPVSTVASEAAFSLGGRVINKYRSSLSPQNVEALVCSNNWLYKKEDTLAPTIEELTEDIFSEYRPQGDSVATSSSGASAASSSSNVRDI